MLTAVVLTKNESANLDRCLTSLKFTDHILVIDDHSTDETVKISKKHLAQVLTHSLNEDYSQARNFALSKIHAGWILFVDADEQVSDALASEITSVIKDTSHTAFSIRRLDFLWGKVLRFGDTGNNRIIRLARSGRGKFKGRVHEIWEITGTIGRLKSPIFHYPHPDIASFLHRLNVYSTIRARELFDQSRRSNYLSIIFKPMGKFIYLYCFRLGFLDGNAGVVHALMMSFYTFLVHGKLFLISKGIS